MGLVRGLEIIITHAFTHQHLFRMYLGLPESRSQKEDKASPVLAKPWICGGAREDGNRTHGLAEVTGDASRTKNVEGGGGGEDLRSTDLHPVKCGHSLLEPMGCPVDWHAASQGPLCMNQTEAYSP